MDSIPTHMTQLSFHQIQLFLLISIKLNIISFVRHLCLKCMFHIFKRNQICEEPSALQNGPCNIIHNSQKKKPKHPTIDE